MARRKASKNINPHNNSQQTASQPFSAARNLDRTTRSMSVAVCGRWNSPFSIALLGWSSEYGDICDRVQRRAHPSMTSWI